MKNSTICIQSILPIKFDPLNKELPVRNTRFVFTPSETIYSQNFFISVTNFQESVENFIVRYNFSKSKRDIHIINIYKIKKDIML